MLKKLNKILRNLVVWRKEKGLWTPRVNTTGYIKSANTDEILLDLMIALSCKRDVNNVKYVKGIKTRCFVK